MSTVGIISINTNGFEKIVQLYENEPEVVIEIPQMKSTFIDFFNSFSRPPIVNIFNHKL